MLNINSSSDVQNDFGASGKSDVAPPSHQHSAIPQNNLRDITSIPSAYESPQNPNSADDSVHMKDNSMASAMSLPSNSESAPSFLGSNAIIYEVNDEDMPNHTDYDYNYDYGAIDYTQDGVHAGDSDFIVRSDGTIQKLSSIDFSKATIFNLTEPAGAYNASFNTSGEPWAEMAGEEALSTARTVAAVFFSVLFLLGLLGNVLVVYTVWRYAGMRRVTYFFLLNLALTNLIYLVLGLPTITVSYLTVDWPFGDHFCKLDNYVMSVSMSVSILTIMATGFDRYLAVVYPVRSRQIRTKTVSLWVISAIWFVSLVAMIPRGLLYATQAILHNSQTPTTLCTRVADEGTLRLDTGLRFGLLYVLPLAVLTICHLRIGHALWTRATPRSLLAPATRTLLNRAGRSERQARRDAELEEAPGDKTACRSCLKAVLLCGNLNKSGRICGSAEDAERGDATPRGRLGTASSSAPTLAAIKERRRMAKIVLALTAVFALGWLPLHLHYLAQDFRLINAVLLPHVLDRGTVALLFCFGANALNPLLYCVFSSNFRGHFRMAFGQCCCKLFKIGKQSSTTTSAGSCRREPLGSTIRKPTMEASGRPLLLVKIKQGWTGDVELGSPSEESFLRRPVLQPRPASLLSADFELGGPHRWRPSLSQNHILTLPGACNQTPVEIAVVEKQLQTSGLNALHISGEGNVAAAGYLNSVASQVLHHHTSSSNLELQRHQDVSPVSVEKIAQIQISPEKKAAPGELIEAIHTEEIPSTHGVHQGMSRAPMRIQQQSWARPSQRLDSAVTCPIYGVDNEFLTIQQSGKRLKHVHVHSPSFEHLSSVAINPGFPRQKCKSPFGSKRASAAYKAAEKGVENLFTSTEDIHNSKRSAFHGVLPKSCSQSQLFQRVNAHSGIAKSDQHPSCVSELNSIPSTSLAASAADSKLPTDLNKLDCNHSNNAGSQDTTQTFQDPHPDHRCMSDCQVMDLAVSYLDCASEPRQLRQASLSSQLQHQPAQPHQQHHSSARVHRHGIKQAHSTRQPEESASAKSHIDQPTSSSHKSAGIPHSHSTTGLAESSLPPIE